MSTDQVFFTRALLDPTAAVPPGLTDPQGRPAGKRFDVYRNNVAASLSDALELAFPVVRALVGDAFFRAMAGVFLRAYPPNSPILMLYGADMPDFLAGFSPVAHLGYLPDVARLEQAMRESYHAADATPIDPGVLAGMPPQDLLNMRVTLAPALRLIRSDWPIAAIWHAHNDPDAPKPQMRAEDVLITRPGFDPAPRTLSHGAAAFVGALMGGATLGRAADEGLAENDSFDIPGAIGLLLAGGAITGLQREGQE